MPLASLSFLADRGRFEDPNAPSGHAAPFSVAFLFPGKRISSSVFHIAELLAQGSEKSRGCIYIRKVTVFGAVYVISKKKREATASLFWKIIVWVRWTLPAACASVRPPSGPFRLQRPDAWLGPRPGSS